MTEHSCSDTAGIEPVAEDNPADVRFAAMNLLARREHSLRELRRKLGRRFKSATVVDAELLRLADENLQSDERFAESYARQRSGRGYGPLRVRQEMRERGLSDTDIDHAFDLAGIDWYIIARDAYYKKFATTAEMDLKEKSRRVRFMQYRGFSGDHYQHLVDT